MGETTLNPVMELLAMLPADVRCAARIGELAEDLGVTPRQVRRLVVELREAGHHIHMARLDGVGEVYWLDPDTASASRIAARRHLEASA